MPGPGQCQVVPSFLREARELEEQRRRDAEWTRRLADGRWNRCARRWASKHSKWVA